LAILPTVLRFRDLRILTLASSGLGLILTAAFVLPNDCCSIDNSLSSAEVEASHTHDHSHGHAHDHSHHHHDHAHASKPSEERSEQETPDLLMAGLGSFQPWMTPIGGLLLILAHALNLKRRWKPSCLKPNCCAEAGSQDVLPLTEDRVDNATSLARAS
jgi:ABC-type nickel/cobalt efflux system permease component RcnA